MKHSRVWPKIFGGAFAALLLSPAAMAVSSGAPEATSGAPGESTCTACHGGSANSGSGRVRIEGFNGAVYSPGQKVRLKVTIEDPQASRWGFQLTARPESDATKMAGELANADTQAQVTRAGVLHWVTHTSAGSRRGTRNSVSFDVDWTAPSADAGSVVFYAAANAANNNGATSGDAIYTTSVKLSASTGGARPTFTSGGVADAWTGRGAGVAPGAWVALSGSDLAAVNTDWSPVSGRPLDTRLGGVSVKVNNVAAVLAQVSPSRIVFLTPGDTPAGDVPVIVERDGQASDAVMVKSAAALPAIQSVAEPNANPGRYHAAVAAAGAGPLLSLASPRGWLLGKPDIDNRVARGVFPGEPIDVFATGLGKTAPSFPTDRLAADQPAVDGTVNVRFGEQSVTASAALLVAPGVYAVRVRVPETLAPGLVPLVVEVNGTASSGDVMLNVEKLP